MRSNRLTRAWNRFFFTGFSGESLGLLRWYVGVGLLAFHSYQFAKLVLLDPFGAQYYFVEPIWYFKLLGIQYHVPALTTVVYAVLMGATVLLAIGKRTQTSIVISILCIFYLKGVRDSFSGDVHHRYIIPMQILFLLLLSRCGEVRSRDARRNHDRAGIQEWEASWPIKTMQLYVAMFYAWSVLAKVRVSGWVWFSGDGRIQETMIQRSIRWGVSEGGEALENGLSFELAQHPGLLSVFGAFVLVFELCFPLVLLVRSKRLRLGFLLAATGFHIGTYVLMDVNFLLLPLFYVVFFDLVPIHAWLRARVPGLR